jgi:hypothetical protein
LWVGSDEQTRRMSYAGMGGKATHHAASAQVFAAGPERCRFVWITDVLPDELADAIAQMMEHGSAVMKATLEANRPK